MNMRLSNHESKRGNWKRNDLAQSLDAVANYLDGYIDTLRRLEKKRATAVR